MPQWSLSDLDISMGGGVNGGLGSSFLNTSASLDFSSLIPQTNNLTNFWMNTYIEPEDAETTERHFSDCCDLTIQSYVAPGYLASRIDKYHRTLLASS
jgi:hypothetical protein